MNRKSMVAGNWKMNGRAAMAAELAGEVSKVAPASIDVVVCPPFPYLASVASILTGVELGAQNLALSADGAFTGEVSAEMLCDVGCAWVIVGHSERRALFGETDQVVADKFMRAQAGGLKPILCLGETLAEREAGQTEAVVARQLQAVIDAAGVASLGNAVLAYEPVWAIGTGLTATPEQAQQVHQFLRQLVAGQDADVAARLRILYGGSVNADNAASLFQAADIDGGLIGGASLKSSSFAAICEAAAL